MTASDHDALLARIPVDGGAIGNGRLRDLLSWSEDRYAAARDALVSQRVLAKGQGRGGSVRRVQAPAGAAAVAAATMSPLIDQIIINRIQSRTLATLRDTLLPKLLSGEIRVPQAAALVEGQPS